MVRARGGAVARLRHGPVGVEQDPAVPDPRPPRGALRPRLRRQREPGPLRLPPLQRAGRIRGRPAGHPRRAPHPAVRLRGPLRVRHDRHPRLHPPPRPLRQARPHRLLAQVLERQRLPRRVRDGGDPAGVRRDVGELLGVGDGVRAAGGGRGRAGGGAGVQPHAVQHAAGHLAARVPERVQDGPPWRAGHGSGAVRGGADHPRRVGAGLRRRLPQGAPRRAHHHRAPADGGPPPAPQRAQPPRPGAPPLPRAVLGC